MAGESIDLLNGWKIDQWCCYFAFVFVATLVVRCVSSALKATEEHSHAKGIPWSTLFARAFCGRGLPPRPKPPTRRTGEQGNQVSSFNPSDDDWPNPSDDYWHPFWLGLLELGSFPILIAIKAYVFIGAWLTLKTIARAQRWQDDRPSFNRFLIGTAVVLYLSVFLANMFVQVR